MAVLVIDVGTSAVRAAIVEPGGVVTHERYSEFLPDTPAAGIVEFDADAYALATIEVANAVLAEGPAVTGVGISTQRATCIVWDRATGRAVAPAQGWQDLRTLGDCLMLGAEGFRFAPNQTATKARSILDAVDPDRTRDLCVGTPDAWIVWTLTGGRSHVTDATNAGVSGLARLLADDWDDKVLDKLRVPRAAMPRIVDSSGYLGDATALTGAPPILGLAGDQQASLVGQGGVTPGLAKITFGTGAMLDVCLGTEPPARGARSANGTFPIICWRRNGVTMWGLEAIMLSAGTNVQWLRDDLGIIGTAAESAEVAAQCTETGGVVYVPAQLGLGTPQWDYGARSGLFGLSRGTGRPEVVRAVLEGVAHRGADLVEAAEADAGLTIGALRIDGGMSENPVFTQALANATGRRVEVAPPKEATAVGAAALAELGAGTYRSWDDVASTWTPSSVVEPTDRLDRDQWRRAVERAGQWHGDLSALDF